MAQPIVQSVIVDIETIYNKTGVDQATQAIERLDKSIEDLRKEQAAFAQDSTKFKTIASEIDSLTKSRNKLTESLKAGTQVAQQAETSLNKLGSAATIAGKAFSALKGLIAVTAVIEFTRNAANATAALDKTTRALQAFGISAAQASNLTKNLNTLTAKVPFESDEILKSAEKLVAFGVSAEETAKTIENLAAIASGSGVSLDFLASAFARASEAGRVLPRDFIELQKKIPGILNAISEATGKTINEVQTLGKSGRLAFEDFQKGVNSITGEQGKFGKVLENYQNSLAGLGKQAKDVGGDILLAFGEEASKGLKSLFQTVIDNKADFINFFTSLGKVASAVASTIGLLITPFVKLISFIDQQADKIDKFLKIGEYSDSAVNERVKEVSDNFFGTVFDEINKKIEEGSTKVSRQLTAAELAALEKRAAALKNAREKYALLEASVIKKVADIVFNDEQAQLLKEGLAGLAEEKRLIKETTEQITALINYEKELVEAAKAAGIKVPKALRDNLTTQIEILTEDVQRKLDEIQKRIEAPKVIKSGFQIVIDDALSVQTENQIDKATKDIVDVFLNKLAPGGKLPKIKLPALPEIEIQNANEPSFLEKLLGDLDDPKVKDQLKIFAQNAADAAETFINSEIEKTDFLISETEKRLSKLLSIQEGGNASQITLEQTRLDRLTEQRQKYVERQRAIDTAQIIANNAISASNTIRTITEAFAKGGNPLVGIAASIALVATIASTVASVTAQLNSLPKFWEGAEQVSDKSKPTRAGRDGHLIWADGRERILSAKQNSQIPRFIKNSELPGLVAIGLAATQGNSMSDKNITKEQRETNRLLKQNSKLIKNQSVKIQILSSDMQSLRLKRMAL